MEFFALDVEGEKEAVAASVDVPLDSSNVGFRLLKKMGWKENTGLGRDGSGKSVAEYHWLALAVQGLKVGGFLASMVIGARQSHDVICGVYCDTWTRYRGAHHGSDYPWHGFCRGERCGGYQATATV